MDYPKPFTSARLKKRTETSLVVIHCADTPPTMDIGAREINQWHVKDNGWSAIGYHFVIRRDGTIEGGRPVDAVGAHAAAVNSTSVGICLVGGKGPSSTSPDGWEQHFEKAQMDSLLELLERLRVDYPAAKVVGHRNVDNAGKTCPQFDAKAWASQRGF